MPRLWESSHLRRVAISLAISAVIAVVTGPPGSAEQPAAGLSGSFTEKSSFYGLFETNRWVVFVFVGLVIWGFWTLWLHQGRRTKTFSANLLRKPRAVASRRPIRWSAALVLIVIGFLLPTFVTDPFWQTVMVEQIAIYVLLALGLNVVVGFAGLLDLGFVAFYAIGAYATAWVTGALPTPPPFGGPINPFFAIPIAIAMVMIAGVILGAPTLRLRGDYLAIVTLGFGEIIFLFANNLFGITGGATGTNQIPHFSIHVGPVKYLWGLGPVPYYYLALGFVVLFLVIFSMLEHSRVGRAWTAIREDEVAAESIGINPLKYKVMAFSIGAASSGFAGVMTAAQTNFVSPSSFGLIFSINILVLVIFGGMGSIKGVLIGAVSIQTISMYLVHKPPSGYQAPDLYIYLGALLVVMMIFRPAGLVPSRRRQREIGLAESGEGHYDEVLTGDTP
jgi:branched-chain amino acid transport system permease protein